MCIKGRRSPSQEGKTVKKRGVRAEERKREVKKRMRGRDEERSEGKRESSRAIMKVKREKKERDEREKTEKEDESQGLGDGKVEEEISTATNAAPGGSC